MSGSPQRDLSREINREVKDYGVEIRGYVSSEFAEILNPEALRFISELTKKFVSRLDEVLQRRREVVENIKKGKILDFLPETQHIREGDWKINASIPRDLTYRRVEITGPVERKMMINALNSGADVYMADFEDAFSPTWSATIQGQINLRDAVNRTIEFTSLEGKRYELKDETATLVVRPRGLHLSEKHVYVDGRPVPASLFDFGLYLYHNHRSLVKNGSGPYFYIPKLENHLDARWWADVFAEAERMLGLPHGTIKVSVLIETITAIFEMDEILYELRDYVTALNLGRWDYIFSFIKRLGHSRRFLLPDRALLTMDKHFLKSAALLLVHTSHKRGAYAIGGMAAQVPIRGRPDVQEEAFRRVRDDKLREISEGFDGAWVAHPDLVPLVMSVFQENVPGPNQLHVVHDDLKITADDLLRVPDGEITIDGLRANINVGLRYLESWLRGTGCVAINYLMEDTATVEICRAQLWQWVHQGAKLSDGREITQELFKRELRGVLEGIRGEMGEEGYGRSKFELAAQIFDKLVTTRDFIEFMPLVAYDYLE